MTETKRPVYKAFFNGSALYVVGDVENSFIWLSPLSTHPLEMKSKKTHFSERIAINYARGRGYDLICVGDIPQELCSSTRVISPPRGKNKSARQDYDGVRALPRRVVRKVFSFLQLEERALESLRTYGARVF